MVQSVLLGANGAGRTTLLEALSGVIPAVSGSVDLNGTEWLKVGRSGRAKLGLAPVIIKRLIPMVRSLADAGVGVLLVEQFAALALSVGDRAYVMARGAIAYQGPCEPLVNNQARLKALYLGTPPPSVNS